MNAAITLGQDPAGKAVTLDVEELLATRLLVQGNSGSGKSHLLRRLLEESAAMVQQVIVDPEGDFVTLAEPFGHVVVDGAAYNDAEIARLGARIREHRASVVLALDRLEVDAQMRCAALFLNALFDAPPKFWYPALVVVDEAQLFAPAAAGEVSDEARRTSLSAMTNLMCRGRKRGLAGIIATQRLAKLAKNVAAEASNFLMGRTFLDIDMIRAADLLGMERRQAEQIRDLDRGNFLGLGPAISRRPIAVKIGAVRTAARTTIGGMTPPPDTDAVDMEALLYADLAEAPPPPPPPPPLADPFEAAVVERRIETYAENTVQDVPQLDLGDLEQQIDEIMLEICADEGCTFQPQISLYQDFSVRCRMRGIKNAGLDATQFRRRFAAALAGFTGPEDEETAPVLQLARSVPDDLLAPFLAIAKAAMEERACPDDEELARIYGTSSLGRVRRMLDYLERSALIVVRTDFSGKRSVTLPHLGLATASF